MITSTKNPKVKWITKLQSNCRFRSKERVFVIEGVRLVEEALISGWEFNLVLQTEDVNQRVASVLQRLGTDNVCIETVSNHVMRAVSDTETPQGILAVLAQTSLPVPDEINFLLILDAIHDPGNVGAILRTAAAAGVQVVLLSPECVDQFSPKVIRAGMGAHFRLPILKENWEMIKKRIDFSKLQIVLADIKAQYIYTQADFLKPLGLIIGSEAFGAGSQAKALADTTVTIPLPGGIESLNAAVAAGILLFEVVRQRSEMMENK